jgi:ribose transport system ATP-binding protein
MTSRDGVAPDTAALPLVLEMHGISKRFPGVIALDDVSFDCRPGEVHALVGENGAGKSTLMNVLGGATRPDAGEIRLAGARASFRHPLEAQRAGIGVIHQELTLIADRTVAQNVFLGREPTRRGMLDGAAMRRATTALIDRLRLATDIAADRLVGRLSVGQQQLVEIIKALSVSPRILVMDEPTAALAEPEAEALFALIGQLRAQGLAIIYISHRLSEVLRLAQRITVLKDGRVVGTMAAEQADVERIVRMMVGRDIAQMFPRRAAPGEIGAELLRLDGVATEELHDITLTLRQGEIVGLAGLQGSGRHELLRLLCGQARVTAGKVAINGHAGPFRSPRAAVLGGLGYLSDDRKLEGLLLGQSVRDNILLTVRALTSFLAGREAGARRRRIAVEAIARDVDVRVPHLGVPVGQLSGGNQQKAVVARWLAVMPQILVFSEPTRGIDVNAKSGIHHLMRNVARSGKAILMDSSELPELIGNADRIFVMRDRSIAGELPGGASEAEVMRLATR